MMNPKTWTMRDFLLATAHANRIMAAKMFADQEDVTGASFDDVMMRLFVKLGQNERQAATRLHETIRGINSSIGEADYMRGYRFDENMLLEYVANNPSAFDDSDIAQVFALGRQVNGLRRMTKPLGLASIRAFANARVGGSPVSTKSYGDFMFFANGVYSPNDVNWDELIGSEVYVGNPHTESNDQDTDLANVVYGDWEYHTTNLWGGEYWEPCDGPWGFSAIPTDDYAQVVCVRSNTWKIGRFASPCFYGQADAQPDDQQWRLLLDDSAVAYYALPQKMLNEPEGQ